MFPILPVVKSLQVVTIRNMIGVIDRGCLSSPAHSKRQQALENTIADNQPESAVSKLKYVLHQVGRVY